MVILDARKAKCGSRSMNVSCPCSSFWQCSLTELPARLSSAVNVHFEDRLEDGKMIFDYRMRPGVVEHSNALALMRAIGLDV